MFDKHETAILRGFDTAVADIGDQLRLCHPLLSFEGDPNTLYVARRFNWQNDQGGLAVADPSEASELATLLPDEHRQPMASGEAVVAAGVGFVQAAATAGIQLDGSEMSFARIHESECWITTATQALFAELETRLVDEARTAFDESLGDAARRGQHLSERGNAALLILRRCGPLRREDLAIRQLAGAKQNREFDLYRRLLIRFELELETQKDDLQKEVERYIALAAGALRYTTVDLPLVPEKTRSYLFNHKVSAAKTQSAAIWMNLLNGNMTGWQTNVFFTIAVRENNSWSKKSLESYDSRERVQQIIKDSPPKVESQIGLLDHFFSESTETLSRKPTIDFSSFDVAPPSVSEKGVVDTAGYREAICP